MSNQCVEAIKNQTCCRCGRTFTNQELILADTDGDLACYGTCWRTLPAKAKPLAPAVAPTPSKPIRRPVVDPEPAVVATRHLGPLSEILAESITDAIKELRNAKS